MNIKIFGILELLNINFSSREKIIKEEVVMSFLLVEIATKNRLGIKLGGNVFSGFLKKFENLSSKMPFELTDDPIDINAECLFIGDKIKIYVNETRMDIGESLLSRMSRVQNFLNDLLKVKHFNKILLDINIESGDEFETIKVKINDFCSKMLELYKQNENWTPTVQIDIDH